MEHSLVKISKALIPAMSSSLSVLAAYISLLMLSGCTSIDPKFDALQPHIQTSPVPNEIVGMWNRKSPEDISTIFFKADGTAFQKTNFVPGLCGMTFQLGNLSMSMLEAVFGRAQKLLWAAIGTLTMPPLHSAQNSSWQKEACSCPGKIRRDSLIRRSK